MKKASQAVGGVVTAAAAESSPFLAAAAAHRSAGKPLTERQQQVQDLKVAGKTRAEIAAELGISEPVVSKTIVVINRKLGLNLKRGQAQIKDHTATEFRSPEVAAAAIEAAADPLAPTQKAAIEKVNRELQAAGMPGKVSEAIVRRMLVKYGNVVTVKRQVTTNEILKVIDEQINLVDSYIDDKVAAESNLRDLGMFKAAMIEKRQLLRGEPTAIISDHERAKLNELLPALMAEMQRRGVTLEGEVVSKEVSGA